MKIAIVTDSTADLSADLVESYNIHVVPNLLIIDGKSLEDNKDISRQEFYERLPSMKTPPTTATASTGTYQQLYEEILQKGAHHIISVHAASLLSGIYNAASAAALAFGERVQVIDSHQITLGLGFQVLAAAEAVAHELPFDKVISVITNVRRRVRVIAMLDTLEYVRRSGRVSWARAQLSNLLRVKPFLEVRDGQVHRLGEARTRQNGIKRLMQFLLDLNALERLAILHTNAEADARRFLADLAPDLPTTPLIVNVTTIIGTHVGPNGLGFAAVPKAVTP